MEIVKSDQDGINVITIAGKLDSGTATEFDARLREYVDEDTGRAVVLEFSGVQTLTSAPLRAILSLAKRMQRHGAALILAAPSENALESLRISGFLKLKLFELTDSLAAGIHEARQAVPGSARPTAPVTPARPSSPLPPPPLSSLPSAAPQPAAAPPPPVAAPPSVAKAPPLLPSAPPLAKTPTSAGPPPLAPRAAAPARESSPPPAIQPPSAASQAKVGWFTYWAGEIQNALDYWTGILRRK